MLYLTHPLSRNPLALPSNHGGKQVIAPYLIIIRVANRTALTSDVITSKKVAPLRFKSRAESTGGTGTLLDSDPVSSMETNGGPTTWAENTIEEVSSQ